MHEKRILQIVVNNLRSIDNNMFFKKISLNVFFSINRN